MVTIGIVEKLEGLPESNGTPEENESKPNAI
jgi:hypothetical protein